MDRGGSTRPQTTKAPVLDGRELFACRRRAMTELEIGLTVRSVGSRSTPTGSEKRLATRPNVCFRRCTRRSGTGPQVSRNWRWYTAAWRNRTARLPRSSTECGIRKAPPHRAPCRRTPRMLCPAGPAPQHQYTRPGRRARGYFPLPVGNAGSDL